jgi:NADPH-dependent curcumin reductase CurA
MLDAVLLSMNNFGRIAACGMISSYNGQPNEIKNLMAVVGKRLKIQGFINGDHTEEIKEEFQRQVGEWLLSGELKYREHITQGLEKTPDAFVGMMQGDNIGKAIVKL